MPIDNCPCSFDALAQKHFPQYFAELDAKRNKRITSDVFTREGNGYKRTMKSLGFKSDFQGCYVFFERDKPVYVGISQNVITRVWNHFNAVNHFGSNLVYKVACERQIIQQHRNDYTGQAYREEFDLALKRVQSWSVTFLEIADHVSLYLFEVYAAMRYDTFEYNSFETH